MQSVPSSEKLHQAIEMARSVKQHREAQQVFADWQAELAQQHPDCADMMQTLWQAYISAQRSAGFWEELSQVEKQLSERLSESHIQLKQNYLRLMQEQ